MPLNFGYLGMGKQSAVNTPVAPTLFFRLQDLPSVRAVAQFAEFPAFDNYGTPNIVPAQRYGEAEVSVVVTPRAIGALLSALLGLPTTTGAAPNFIHSFTPKTSFSYWTVEAQDGIGIHRLVGGLASRLEFTHRADGYLTARATLVGVDRTTTGTAATPSYEDSPFPVGQATVSVAGSAITARVEEVSVVLDFPKSPFQSLSTVAAADVYPEGTGDVTANMTVVFDSTGDANRLSDYLAATARAVALTWTRDANTEITISFQGILTEDPWVRANNDTGMARARFAFKAVRSSGNLVTVTLKNGQSSY